MKIIKRYKNRKLYDTDASRYVTLSDINKMIKEGIDVKVVDNDTGEDITSLVMTQVIHTEEKKKRFLPQDGLKWLLKHGEDAFAEFINNIQQIRKEAERQFQKFMKGGKGKDDDRTRHIGDVMSSYLKSIEEFQKKAEKNIENLLDRVGSLINLPREIIDIGKRIKKLEDEVKNLKRKIVELEKRGNLH